MQKRLEFLREQGQHQKETADKIVENQRKLLEIMHKLEKRSRKEKKSKRDKKEKKRRR